MKASPRWWLVTAGVCSSLMVVALVTVLLTPVPFVPNLYIVGLASFPVVGGLVMGRQPGNVVGRLMVAIGALFSVGAASNTYLWTTLETGLPRIPVAEWLAVWTWWPAGALMAFLVAVFPSGRITSQWIRLPLRFGAGCMILFTLISMVLPVSVNVIFFGDQIANPWGLPALAGLSPLGDVGIPALWILLLALAVADLIGRWRRARGVERLQMRWVWLGVAFAVLLGGAGLLVDAVGRADRVVWIGLWAGFGALPAAVGAAVTRYRLYEIDRLISRTVSYGVVVAVLAGIFSTIVIGLPQAVGLTAHSPVLVAGATLTVAACFAPAHRRIRDVVDRRFNRTRYDAQQEMGRFSDRLRGRLDLEDLSAEILGVVDRTMEPASASIWMQETHQEFG